MAKLQETFERVGMKQVTTYINTGNIIFLCSLAKRDAIVDKLEQAIEDDFGFHIKVLLRSHKDFKPLMNFLPDDWQNDSNTKCDVMFLWEDIDRPSLPEELRNPEDAEKAGDAEQIHYLPGVVVWYVDRAYISKCHAMQKLANNKLYKKMTVRNVNTARKVYQLLADLQATL